MAGSTYKIIELVGTSDQSWEDAAKTCAPSSAYNHDLTNRVLSVPICHLSLFSLLGPTYQMYLPLVLRDH